MPTPIEPVFWRNEEDALWDAIVKYLMDAFIDGAAGGVSALPKEFQVLADFDLINTSALDFARRYRYNLIRGITDTTRQQTQQAIADWIQSGESLSALEATLEPIFGKIRAQMIAATEVTRAFAEGNAAAWTSTGFVSQVRWMTAKDERVCPICGPKAGQLYPIGSTQDRPPAHPRCRCWIQPVVDVEGVMQRVEDILNG